MVILEEYEQFKVGDTVEYVDKLTGVKNIGKIMSFTLKPINDINGGSKLLPAARIQYRGTYFIKDLKLVK